MYLNAQEALIRTRRLFRGVDEGCIAYHTKDVYPRYIRMTNRDTGTPYAMHGEQTTKYGCVSLSFGDVRKDALLPWIKFDLGFHCVGKVGEVLPTDTE